MNNLFLPTTLFFISYLIGSIPFSYLTAKLKGIDLKKTGTKNPGGSNAILSAGLIYGIAGGLLDVTKGAIVIFTGRYFQLNFQILSVMAIGAIVGHCWSIFLNFKGGRGIGTTIGTLLFMSPQILILSMIPGLFFLILVILKKNKIKNIILDTAIGTLLGLIIFICLSIYQRNTDTLVLGIIVLLIVLIRRTTDNIKEYKEKDRVKILLTRIFYDREIYDHKSPNIKFK